MMTLTMVMMMIALMMTKEGVCCCLMSLLAKVSPQTAQPPSQIQLVMIMTMVIPNHTDTQNLPIIYR